MLHLRPGLRHEQALEGAVMPAILVFFVTGFLIYLAVRLLLSVGGLVGFTLLIFFCMIWLASEEPEPQCLESRVNLVYPGEPATPEKPRRERECIRWSQP